MGALNIPAATLDYTKKSSLACPGHTAHCDRFSLQCSLERN